MSALRSSLLARGFFFFALMLLSTAALQPAAADEPVCTLSDRIKSANTNTAVGFCPAGTSHDVITITEDITLSEALPPIRGTITIEGGGHTISGGNKFRIFEVDGGNVTINNLTLTEGSAEESVGGGGPGTGGAILMRNGAEISANHSVFTRNYSSGGGAIGGSRSKLTVNNSIFSNNRAIGNGGAIYLWYSTSTITNSSFVGNSTRTQQIGGAIFVGIDVELEVTNSSFNGNYAGHGGAVGSEVWTPGGAIPSTTTLTHVTMMNNEAGMGGHTLWIDDDDKNFNLRNSIIAGLIIGNCQGPLKENIGNLIADGSCASMAGGDPMLAEMNGSPAHFPPLDGSPALDAADARFCPDTDQLGTPRPHGGGCDIGAIESTTAIPVPTEIPAICPLPDQIIAANTDMAVGNCPAGNGADVIYLIRDFTLSEKLPPITSEITIEGNGFTISGDNDFGIFAVDGGALTIRNVTLTEGNGSNGGAIMLQNGGRASVANVTFTLNTAFFGGAIATESFSDRLNVSNSSFVGNSAKTSGGAILVDGGIVEVSGSAFRENRAQVMGGAFATSRGQLAMSNSTLHGNKAEKGGGIYVNGGETTLTHLTLMNNAASRINGAGIYREAGSLYLRNSIIAGSGSGDDCSGGLDQNRGNFSQDGTCAPRAGGDPLLADLVESPAYHPLLDASPAHGTADPAFCLSTDQLGKARPHCDIGAIETERDPNYTAAPQAGLPSDCSLADQIIAANTDEPAGACPAGIGADTISLTQNITLSAALPPISGDLTLDGNGHTISGDSRFRIFDIEAGKVTIKHMTLVNGRNTSEHPDGYGGAIRLQNSAWLTASLVTFRGNKARFGGAISAVDNSILQVYNSRFFDNSAASKGGAIWSNGSHGCVDNNSFRRNSGHITNRNAADVEGHIHGGFSQCGSVFNSFSDT